MLKHILVPLDQSDLSERALEYAQKLIDASGQITLLMVVDIMGVPYPQATSPYSLPVTYEKEDYARMQREMVEHATAYLERKAQQLKHESFNVATRTITGHPADGILEVADELNVDVIVMSTHGRSGISRWVFGSITQKVLSAGMFPVLVVPNIPDQLKT